MSVYNYSQDIQKEFDINSLKNKSEYIMKDIADLQKHLDKINNQALKVLNTDFYNEVRCTREKSWYDKKVYYIVTAYKIPKTDVPGAYKQMYHRIHKRFGGLEKKAAIEYAEELAKKYNCNIIYKNVKGKDVK